MRFGLLLPGFCFAFIGTPFLFAQTPLAPSETNVIGKDYPAIVANFFDLVKQVKHKEAADYLINTNPEEINDAALHEALFVSLNRAATFGEFKRFAPIISKLLGNDIAYVYGVGLYQKHPIRFEFIFSRGDNHWQLLSYSYSIEVTDELRAIAGVPLVPPKATVK